ncbi:MAG: YgcG family protein [Pyrinomonadaceae bacterium]
MNEATTMIQKFAAAVAFMLLFCLSALAQNTQPWSQNTSPLPAPTGPVNDYAGVLDAATVSQLNQKLIAFRDSSGVELAVAVVKTTGERPIFEYSLAVARGWGIGSKEDDNPSGLLFVAIDDRKYFTQISKDLEDELPDGLVGSLQRQYLVPEFRKGNYSKGISDTIDAYVRTIESKGSTTAPPAARPTEPTSNGSSGFSTLFCCLIIVIILLVIIFSNRGGGGRGSGRGKKDWGGGFGSALPWIIGSAINSSSSSSSSDWGSGWSSGGSDWGGFGGGGDFGGGGAGGDW